MCVVSVGKFLVRDIIWRCISVVILGRSFISVGIVGRVLVVGSICRCIGGCILGRSFIFVSVVRVLVGMLIWWCIGVFILVRSCMGVRCVGSGLVKGSGWFDIRGFI